MLILSNRSLIMRARCDFSRGAPE